MPKYNYTAKDDEGKSHSGTAEASDTSHLYSLLRAKSLTLTASSEVETIRENYRMKAKEIASFSRQIAEMLGSGLTVIRAVGILKSRSTSNSSKGVYEALYRNIQNGVTLAESMSACGKTFPTLLINMYTAGEASGQLEKTARKMAVHYENEHRLNSKVKSAMTYPAILAGITLVVVILIFTVILPVFFTLFKDMQLPLITRIVMGISSFLIHYWYLAVIAVLLIILLWQFLLTKPAFRTGYDRIKLRLPVIGPLLKIIYTARFAQTMSSLYSSGLPLINTLQISSTLIGNMYISNQFDQAVKDVKNGETLSSAIEKIDGFDNKLEAAVYVGEESGKLVSMLESISESYNFEAETATTRLVTLLEPAMIVVMALVIGAIMLSVMLPIFSLYNNIQ